MRRSGENTTNGHFRVLAFLREEEDRGLLAAGGGEDVHLRVIEHSAEVVEALQKESFELLLLDVDIPQEELRRTIGRVRSITLDLPIIFLTAQPSNEVMLFSMETGSLDVLRKPMDSQLLQRLVANQRERLRGTVGTNVETFVVEKRVSYMLPSEVDLLPLVANKVAADIHGTGAIDAGQMYSLNLAVFECLTNALEHGNLGIGYDRKTELVREGEYLARLRNLSRASSGNRQIHLEYEVEPDRVQVHISDEGPGFDFGALQRRAGGADEEAFHGRGLLLAMKMVDSVSYDRSRNRLTLTVERSTRPGRGLPVSDGDLPV